MLWTKLVANGPLQYALSVVAENTAGHDLAFVLPDQCPAGPLALEGLAEDYDYYQTCNAGACPGPRGMQTVQLAARERRVLAQLKLDARGGACNAPLESAFYRVRAVVPPLANRVCVEAASLDLRNVKIPLKPAPKLTPQPPPAAPASDPYACARSDECTIACPQVTGCCGWSCGCRNAIRRDQVDSFAARYSQTCSHPPHCPVVGCAYEPAASAVCRNGRCTAVSGVGFN
jgi:hypothetical protein